MRTERDLVAFQAALTEVGYAREAQQSFLNDGGYFQVPRGVPEYVLWKAAAVVGQALACWPCHRVRGDEWVVPRCDHPVDPFCPEDAP